MINVMTVTPAFAVSGLTTVNMSASATDPDGDTVSYQWSFGGSTASGPSFATTLTGDGNRQVTVTVSDGRGGTATDTRTVTIGNGTGNWVFLFNGNACGATAPPIAHLVQTGRVINGTTVDSLGPWCNVPAGNPGKFDVGSPGTIDEQGNVTGMRVKFEGYLDIFLTLKMDATGRVMTGTARATNGQQNTMTLQKQ